ncbi:MAG: ATP-binding protein [Syntrophaceae bacterium]|nr:ATP-binding protein [Patescibacteria group bacterium]MCG2741370.1 ATP-binding protein [Syntrophaceae bacterium]
MEQRLALSVIESLRKGIPPQRGTDLYSVGYEKLIEGIKRHHLKGIEDRGIIRFISGSWGAGKTHFFRLLRDITFKERCLVSNVELSVNDAPLNKFERVFYGIIRNVMTPSVYDEDAPTESAPFGRVVRESLLYLGAQDSLAGGELNHESYSKALQKLMADQGIDIDFKKMIQKYWETYLPEAADAAIQDQVRAEILQWFSGEGAIGAYRKRFGVNQMINKNNAKLMLQSLAGFVRLSGYRGLVILFDEAEQSYSIMKKSALKDAQNNLLSLINNIEAIPGLFLIYATTPEFYTNPKYGIVIYGALAGRIGKPEERSPRALNTIWNLDALETSIDEYGSAAKKIRDVYLKSYPEDAEKIPDDNEVEKFVDDLFDEHPSLSAVRFWRVLVTALVAHFDDRLEGDVRDTKELYEDVMDKLREA